MKSKEEIEQLAEIAVLEFNKAMSKIGFGTYQELFLKVIKEWYADGYTQCQEDMIELLKEEIRRAFIHGQGNAQMMEAGLERDEVDDYTNSRMLSLKRQD
jgi:hypothetical protein